MLKDCTIQKKLLFTHILFGFVPFVIVALSILFYAFHIEDMRHKEAILSDAKGIASTLNITIDNMVDTTFFLIGDNTVRTFMLCNSSIQSSAYTQAYQNVLRVLYCMPYSTRSYQYIILQSSYDRYVRRGIATFAPDFELTDEERQIADQKTGGWFWSCNNTQIAICRKLRDMYDVRRGLGYIKVGISKTSFEKIFLTPSVDYYALVTKEQELICNLPFSSEELLERNHLDWDGLKLLQDDSIRIRIDNQDYFLTATLLADMQTIYLNITRDRLQHWRLTAIMVIATLFLACILIRMQMTYARKWITKPILKLADMMNAIETEEDYSVRFHIQCKDEISTLANRFNLMAEKLDVLYNEVYRSQLHSKEAELKALQAEMHPHFLFNTLSAIYWTIKAHNEEGAAAMVTDLSNMFQYSLMRTTGGLVSLEKEVQHMESYLRLQKSRMMNNFTYSIDVQSGLDDLAVMKLILQPLVENAIVHGLNTKSEEGMLSVSIYAADQTLYYLVYDNGVGADFAKIQSLLCNEADLPDHTSHGIALSNMNRRLKLKFGEGYGITCKLPADGGTVFIVSQPLMSASGQEVNRLDQTDDC